MGLFTMSSFDNNFDYDKAWREVKEAMDQGLPQSALTKTEEIYDHAKTEKNKPQLVKSMVYIARLTINTDEKGIEKSIIRLQEIAENGDFPVKHLAASYLAELYQKYFDNFRYEISQRSEIDGDQGADFRTWSTQQFIQTIEKWYLTSISDKATKNITIDEYKEAMNEYTNEAVPFRPSLYEVLVDRVFEFLNNYDSYSNENPESFQLYDERFFAPAQQFSGFQWQHADTTSLRYKVVQLYQEVLSNEINQKNQWAEASYDQMRLEYVYNQSTLTNKDQLYQKSLRQAIEKYSNIDYTAEIYAKLANVIQGNTEDTLANVEAIKICEEAIKKYPNTTGAGKCKIIVNNIKRPSLTMYGEQVYPSKQAMLFALDYNNVSKVDAAIVKIDAGMVKAQQRNQEAVIAYLKSAKKQKSWTISLQPSKALRSQKIEFGVEAIPYGQYALWLHSADKNIDQFLIFHVSDLAYSSFMSNDERMFTVVDRIKGLPVKGAKVSIFQQKYEPNTRSEKEESIGQFTTDAKGRVKMKGYQDSNFKVVVSKGKDVLDLQSYHYNYYRGQSEEYKFAEFYTDRAIYRPGQLVYYKVILLKNDAHQVPTLIKNTSVDCVVRDANYQEIGRFQHTSNDFGSFNGSFALPSGKLNGNFTIEIQSKDGISGQTNILVEEYKRPTFEVIPDEVKGEFKINDAVKVTGIAQTLAGTVVDGANVRYKVTRTARFPWWGWWWRMPYNSTEFIISQGQTTTDDEGKYNLTFQAIPDLKVDKNHHPVFSYKVEVEVTDQRGETRTATSFVSIAYQPYALSANLNRKYDVSQLPDMKISATNTNGQALDVSGDYKIWKLKEPSSVKIKKYWEGKINIPMPMAERKMFPQYPTGETDEDYSKWAIASEIVTGKFASKDSIDIKKILHAGVYKLQMMTKDKGGNEIKNEQYFVVTDFAKSQFPKTGFLHTLMNATQYEPGSKLELSLGASDKPLHVSVIIEKDGKILMDQSIKVDKTNKVSLPITEAYRGGINVTLSYVVLNRTFEENLHIQVPWSQKQLTIKYETFRDKTLPGSEETYRIKIAGLNSDKVIAEMVAAMYDASLDQFTQHSWRHDFYPESYSQLQVEYPGFQMVMGNYYFFGNREYEGVKYLTIPALMPLMDNYYYGGGGRSGEVMMAKRMKSPMPGVMMDAEAAAPALEVQTANENVAQTANVDDRSSSTIPTQVQISPRKNLKETVFFFPEMRTDADGNVILSYTMNEALTKWKLMTLAHTQDFKVGYDERLVQTQKELMVFPNAPRFVRDGDKVEFAAKVTNMSEKSQQGEAKIQIWDAITMKDVTSEIVTSPTNLAFTIEKGKSQGLTWMLQIPDVKYSALTYRITAVAANHSDAEENTLPVVTNRMLVTETMPFWIKGNATRTFTFNAMKNNVSNTKKDFRYTFEYTSNPVWYAIQALPYIHESGNISTQAIADRMYANILASKIANAHPKIKAVFDQWNAKDKNALLSNLSKNEELKSAILEETPWVRQAMSEAEQKRSIAALFDLNKMADERKQAIAKLQERQLSNGGFPWITGGRDNVYTTQNVMENIGHLYQLGALSIDDKDLSTIITRSLVYMDNELISRYEQLKADVKKYGGKMEDDHLDELSVYYLYVRTFFKHVNPSKASKEARDYYFSQAKKYWLHRNLMTQAMIGLIMHRNDDHSTTQNIVKSLRERSFYNDELGMYWNEGNGFHWYQLPIERHALMIELFAEASPKADEADKMKIWLLKNKQTNHWPTSKSTSVAIYALLIQGEDSDISKWVTESVQPVIMVGNELINTSTNHSESGTGYIKKAWNPESMIPEMSQIKVTNNNKSIAWGAVYYQYLEQLDKIKHFADTPLKLQKKYFKVVRTAKGDVLTEVSDKTPLIPGDKIKIRIELRVDRDMDYVMMKDMRPSGVEPENVISQYQYQGQLGYYETTKDMATHFYFTHLPKGTFVFEYPVRVVHKGDFSSGVTTIECAYAPEYSSHSEGTRLLVH